MPGFQQQQVQKILSLVTRPDLSIPRVYVLLRLVRTPCIIITVLTTSRWATRQLIRTAAASTTLLLVPCPCSRIRRQVQILLLDGKHCILIMAVQTMHWDMELLITILPAQAM